MEKSNNIQMISSEHGLTVETFGDNKPNYSSDDAYWIATRALEHFGANHQQLKAIEEFTEAALALAKHLQSGTDVDSVIDELADVNVMILQMGILFGHQKVIDRYFYKLKRLDQMLNDS